MVVGVGNEELLKEKIFVLWRLVVGVEKDELSAQKIYV